LWQIIVAPLGPTIRSLASSTIWLKLRGQILSTQLTNSPSTHPTLERTSWRSSSLSYLICYLKKTQDLGTRFKPDRDKGFECYCDADFSGNWNRHLAPFDPSTAKSRSGWIVFYAGCPVIWASKLHTRVALSTTEAEYIAMSQSLRDVLPIMFLVQEICKKGFQVISTSPMYTAKFLKTTPVRWNSKGFRSFALVPNTSTYVTITFTNT
jgi:hypothetical protein